MRTPTQVAQLTYLGCCADCSLPLWEKRMEGTVKANGRQIRKLIKEHLPDLYYDLALNFYNPYENRSVKKKGLLVYVHSGIEYFLKFQN